MFDFDPRSEKPNDNDTFINNFIPTLKLQSHPKQVSETEYEDYTVDLESLFCLP